MSLSIMTGNFEKRAGYADSPRQFLSLGRGQGIGQYRVKEGLIAFIVCFVFKVPMTTFTQF